MEPGPPLRCLATFDTYGATFKCRMHNHHDGPHASWGHGAALSWTDAGQIVPFDNGVRVSADLADEPSTLGGE